MKFRILIHFFLLIYFLPATAQWTNRYPKVAEHGHHVYLEGFELPILTSGPMDPAPSPDKINIAFAAKGWLWLLNLQTMTATRITSSPGMDSRPEWSSDGNRLVFVRDNGRDTQIVMLNLVTGEEVPIGEEQAIDLDPFFSDDGLLVYYSSAINGSFDLWSVNTKSGEKELVLASPGIQRRPVFDKDGNKLVYLNKAGFNNSIMQLDLNEGTSELLTEGRLTSQVDFTLSNDGDLLAYTWPQGDDYEIRLMSLENPSASVGLTTSQGLPLAPAFDADGEWVYYAEAGINERTELKRISVNGGEPQTLSVKTWNWGTDTRTVKIISMIEGKPQPVRMNVVDELGHPLIPEEGAIRSEGQNGMVFYYSSGEIELTVPVGQITITAVQGFLTEALTKKVDIDVNPQVVLNLQRIWEPNKSGWYSGDNHFHLNYGGTYQLDPEDIRLDMEAEGLDVAFPLLANLYLRFPHQELWGWKSAQKPLIWFGQEVRSHFLGHVSLIGTKELYWPWIWGPYYELYRDDDRTNAGALRHARSQGGLAGYVHPVSKPDPFSKEEVRSVPVSLVTDCVLGEADILEVACLWTDERGTASVWHEILNIGVPLAASSGSDVMNDYYRTMAIGATRVFVKPQDDLTYDSYLEALKNGRSFVSNGPMMEFLVGGKEPGEVIPLGPRSTKWTLKIHSAVSFQNVEIFVNGQVVWAKEVNAKPGTHSYRGSLKIPEGGWVTARVYGGEVKWPFMDSYPFAETSPVWFGSIGSTDPSASKQAATKLLKVLMESRKTLVQGYGDSPIPNLLQHFDKAQNRLEEIISQ